jgi:hypothetical protein
MEQRALAKVRAHTKSGAANSLYIGSLREDPTRDAERQPGGRLSAPSERDEQLAEIRDGTAERVDGDDPIWGWNVPWFIADDGYGIWETKEGRTLLESRALTLSAHHMGLGPAPQLAEKLSVEEKRENLVAHFSALADLEERLGGLSHFRIILTVGPEVSIRELKEMANAFLRENFPLCPAFVAIHDDTQHRHAHVYVHARQLDNRRVDLGQDYFRLDESWMRVCAEHLGTPEIYTRHVELKEETRGWNIRAEKASEAGKPLPPKPDRWGDHHDTLLTFRPFDDRWCGRLQAQTRLAEVKVTWLELTKAQMEETAAARVDAKRLRERLEAAAERRAKSKSESKRRMPAEVITVSEQRELKVYERDILNAGKHKLKDTHKPTAPEQTVAQTVIQFDGAVAARGEQLGFDFGILTDGQGRGTDASQPRTARTGQKSQARKHAGTQSPPAAANASPSAEETARSLGCEMVAETRLAFYESSSSAAKTRKEKQQLKGQLIAAREEHAHAQREAEICRAHLASQGAAEPPYRLTGDERNYLKLVSKRLPESLRARIEHEVSRAQIVADRSEEPPVQNREEPAPRANAPHAQERKEKEIPSTVGEQKHFVTSEPQREDSARQDAAARATVATTEHPPEPPIHTLPDDEVRRMIVDFELSRALAIALRATEEDFNAAPHQWESPTHKVTLAEVETRISDGLKRGQDIRGLDDLKGHIQDQIAAERINTPMRRKEAEDEACSLKERLTAESATRGHLGLTMPDAVMTPDELREMVRYAEVSRDPELLRTAYEIELRQALRNTNLTGDGSHVRRLEEKYVGVELKAEVSADSGRQFLTAQAKNPEKTLLPALNETGRDVALTLEQAGPQKGIRGVFSKVVETAAHRRFRELLVETKETYFRHLRSGVEGRETFREVARAIKLECRERGREFGLRAPAVPELTRAEIQEIRDYAVKQTGANRDRWLSACTGAQRLADERDAAAWQPAKTVEVAASGLTAQQRSEMIRKEIETERAKADAYQRVSRVGIERDQQGIHKSPERNSHKPDRSEGSRSRGR